MCEGKRLLQAGILWRSESESAPFLKFLLHFRPFPFTLIPHESVILNFQRSDLLNKSDLIDALSQKEDLAHTNASEMINLVFEDKNQTSAVHFPSTVPSIFRGSTKY